MRDKFKNVLIGVLAASCIVLIGVVIYQRLVINEIIKTAVEMYQFIQAGCPFSQLQ
jgi:hypothetical protein